MFVCERERKKERKREREKYREIERGRKKCSANVATAKKELVLQISTN
jgi:hypothetical protein